MKSLNVQDYPYVIDQALATLSAISWIRAIVGSSRETGGRTRVASPE